LPAFADPAPANLTGSKRLRLRLDPEVASQPLPDTQRIIARSDAVSMETAEPSSAMVYAAETMDAIEPVAESSTEIAGGDPLPGETTEAPNEAESYETPESDVAPAVRSFEMPPVAETANQVWVPPGPGHAEAPDWMPPVANRPLRFEEIAPVADAPKAQTETQALRENRLLRPELRRAGPSLAHLSRPEQTLGRGFWILLVLLILAIGAVLYFFAVAPRLATGQAQNRPPAIFTVRPVAFVVARRTNPVVELPVSGSVEASRETALYARTTGYVKDWQADIGDRVKAGQVLAELDTPEVDHQLVESRATADQAKAALALAQNEADRWNKMAQEHSVSQQDADARIAARNEAQARDNAAEAAVGRLVDVEMFKEITAPYAGTVTSRNLEVGTLVGVGPGPAGSELFRLIQTDPVRVFVNVPEANAPGIRPGLPAKLQVAAFPGRVYSGAVVRDAGALDSQTHMLRTEIGVANPDGSLMPGMDADVRLLLFDKTPGVFVPASTIVLNGAGASIARLVPSDGREVVHFVPVKVGREFGSEVEVLDSALTEGDRLVANPPPDLKDGMVVSAQPFVPVAVPSLLPPKPSAPRTS
jgi:membrane fusion protein, multidrug efflux system